MPPNLDLGVLVANAAASAAGALFAGYFGVLWALRKRRAELAIDRRANWTEERYATSHAATGQADRAPKAATLPPEPVPPSNIEVRTGLKLPPN
jgi:hypothetical protein